MLCTEPKKRPEASFIKKIIKPYSRQNSQVSSKTQNFIEPMHQKVIFSSKTLQSGGFGMVHELRKLYLKYFICPER